MARRWLPRWPYVHTCFNSDEARGRSVCTSYSCSLPRLRPIESSQGIGKSRTDDHRVLSPSQQIDRHPAEPRVLEDLTIPRVRRFRSLNNSYGRPPNRGDRSPLAALYASPSRLTRDEFNIQTWKHSKPSRIILAYFNSARGPRPADDRRDYLSGVTLVHGYALRY